MHKEIVNHAILSQAVYHHEEYIKSPNFVTDFGNSAYIFTSSCKGQVHIIFKGTDSLWHTRTNAYILPTPFPYAKGLVHSGYLEHYKRIRTDLLDFVFNETLLAYRRKTEPITINIAGHSMGGALACIMALDCAELLPNSKVNVYTYGAPPFCDQVFIDSCASYHPRLSTFRVIHKDDIIPNIPLPWKHQSFKRNSIVIDHQPKQRIRIPQVFKHHSMTSYINGLRQNYYRIQ